MIDNFIADVRKGSDLLKSFEQNHLINNMCSFTYNYCEKVKCLFIFLGIKVLHKKMRIYLALIANKYPLFIRTYFARLQKKCD